MRVVDPEPWALGMRLREEPTGLRRYHLLPGAPADGRAIGELPLDEGTWIHMVNRDGVLIPVRGATVLQGGDEVLLLADTQPEADTRLLFTAAH